MRPLIGSIICISVVCITSDGTRSSMPGMHTYFGDELNACKFIFKSSKKSKKRNNSHIVEFQISFIITYSVILDYPAVSDRGNWGTWQK